MLPRKNRLSSGYEYRRIRRLGRTYKCPLFNLTILETGGKKPRFGIITSKRLDKRATVRNRMRRILAAALRDNLEELNKVVDVVIVVRPGMLDADSKRARHFLDALFKQANLKV